MWVNTAPLTGLKVVILSRFQWHSEREQPNICTRQTRAPSTSRTFSPQIDQERLGARRGRRCPQEAKDDFVGVLPSLHKVGDAFAQQGGLPTSTLTVEHT